MFSEPRWCVQNLSDTECSLPHEHAFVEYTTLTHTDISKGCRLVLIQRMLDGSVCSVSYEMAMCVSCLLCLAARSSCIVYSWCVFVEITS